jgi:hypothetical protein
LNGLSSVFSRAQVIDKTIPTAGLLAQVMVAKFADHLRCTGKRKSLAEPA